MHAHKIVCRVAIALLVTVQVGVAQQGYKKPPKEVLDILNAPVTPVISVSPTRDNIPEGNETVFVGLSAGPGTRSCVVGLELLRLDAKRTGEVSGLPVGQALETALRGRRDEPDAPARRQRIAPPGRVGARVEAVQAPVDDAQTTGAPAAGRRRS